MSNINASTPSLAHTWNEGISGKEQSADHAMAPLDESRVEGSGALTGRTIANSPGENRQRAQTACGVIKSILSALSNALMAIVLSPLTLAKGIHTYVISPCLEEFRSMRDDANQSVPRMAPPYRPSGASSLDKAAERINDWINDKIGYTPKN